MSSVRALFAGLGLTVSLAALSGCADEPAGLPPILCNRAEDCPGYMDCQEGVCVEVTGGTCAIDAHCDRPGACEENPGRCVGGRCIYPARVCDDGPENTCEENDTVFVSYPAIGRCDPGTDSCVYTPTRTPCADCAATCLASCATISCDETAGGCKSEGVCVAGDIPTCSYQHAVDGTTCDRPGSTPGSLDGVCADGLCVACRASTDCPAAPELHPECFAAGCDDNVCVYTPQPAQSCAPQACTNGYTDYARVCGAAGSCPSTGGVSCNGLKCNSAGTACLTSCSGDQDCLSGLSCSGGSCVGLLPDGASCVGLDGDACQSGRCVDGVCCKTACDGVCQRCGAGDGVCDEVPADDSACGVINCDGLDTDCRDYHDLTTNRCASFGACKQPNSAACAGFTDREGQHPGCDDPCHYCSGGDCTHLTSGQGYGCDATATTCSGADSCDASGTCRANDLSGQQPGCNTPCHFCGGGACTYLTSGQGYGCTGAASTCKSAESCSASGVCQSTNLSGQQPGCNSPCYFCSEGGCYYLTSGQGYGCTGAATACKSAESCSATGVCEATNYGGQQPGCDTPCHYCAAGVCTYLQAGSGYGCTAPATACSAADTCNSSGICLANDLPTGQQTGCNDACHYCYEGDCVYLTSGQGYGCTGNASCGQPYACNGSGTCVDPCASYHCFCDVVGIGSEIVTDQVFDPNTCCNPYTGFSLTGASGSSGVGSRWTTCGTGLGSCCGGDPCAGDGPWRRWVRTW